jgi:hypothetical protein
MNDEMERICKEAIMTYYKALSRDLPGGTEENRETLQSGSPVSRKIFEAGTSQTKSRSLTD